MTELKKAGLFSIQNRFILALILVFSIILIIANQLPDLVNSKQSYNLVLIITFVIAIGTLFLFLRITVIRPLKALTESMMSIDAEADLTQHSQLDRRKDEFGLASQALNHLQDQFRESLRQINETTGQLTIEVDHIKAVSETTANSVSEQRRRTEVIATAVNEMEHSAHEVKGNAEHTAEATHEANTRAEHGQAITHEAIQSIRALSSSISNAALVINKLAEQSHSVGSVLDVIRGISEQTNLLALNAAIEAARAGEMGRGFAVVADEVRTLASRTHESTEEIQRMIEDLQRDARNAVDAMEQSVSQADEGVNSVQDAVSALSDIVEQVSRITALNTQMATASEEQSYVAEEINRNIIEISQLADSTADDASKTINVSESLVRLANRLESLVMNFRL
jgi:methyl-accepting chemotaxis protein